MRYRTRHIEPKIKEYSQFFKIVLITGARQVGKSSILAHTFPNLQSIVFDPTMDRYGARQDPDLFLKNFPTPLILDEVQHVPELLTAIKRHVDKRNDTGIYFMTGSQNLSVLRQVSESLAGRVGIIHLDGMTLAEMNDHGEETCWLQHYITDPSSFWKDLSQIKLKSDSITQHLWRGSLPGLIDAPDSIVPGFMQSYSETYIERDVRVIGNINDLSEFGKFLKLSAALTSCETNYSQLGREIGISPKTAQSWLHTLIHSYQWLELPAYHGNAIKRLSQKPKGHLRDTGLTCNLMGISTPTALSTHPALGNIFESWVVCWIVRMAQQMPAIPNFYHWRTNGGAEVDLVMDIDGYLYPIEIKCQTRLTANDARGIRAFRDTYGSDRVKTGLIIYAGDVCREISDCTVCIPWNTL